MKTWYVCKGQTGDPRVDSPFMVVNVPDYEDGDKGYQDWMRFNNWLKTNSLHAYAESYSKCFIKRCLLPKTISVTEAIN
jgi:hypothetical protein